MDEETKGEQPKLFSGYWNQTFSACSFWHGAGKDV